MIVAIVAGLILLAGGTMTIWASQRSAVAPAPALTGSPSSRPPADDIRKATDALRAIQQETVDQLQVVQDQLAAQRLETKKLADEIAEITDRLAVVQMNLPAASSTSVILPKSHH
jgi:septal ring factor EnvC (AmiA/AmiB activator)